MKFINSVVTAPSRFKKFIMNLNLSGVNAGTWKRTIMLFLSITMYVLKTFNIYIPFIDENIVAMIVVAIIGGLVFLQSFWKNNSFTKAAQDADDIMQEKKGEV